MTKAEAPVSFAASGQPVLELRDRGSSLAPLAGLDRRARKPGARWHERLLAASDLVFETDAAGRFAFIGPDPALGWAAAALLGQPSDVLLLPDGHSGTGLNPFRPLAPMRRGRAWLRTSGGEAVCLSFAAAPLLDEAGQIVGAGGTGVDVTEDERWQVAAAAAMRRLEVLDHTLWRLRQEVAAPDMIGAALSALAAVLGADAAAIVRAPLLAGVVPGAASAAGALRHHAGSFSAAAVSSVLELAGRAANRAIRARLESGEFLVCPCLTRFRPPEVLAFWRSGAGSGRWTEEDGEVAGSAAGVLRVVLEQEAIQEELFHHSPTDPLTGLFNRRAFTDELARRIERLEREALPGTLLIVDVDGLGRLNDCAGVEAGDTALCAVASLLRTTFRPADLLGRLGGDAFAAWLDGADDFAAAERAEALRIDGASRLAGIAGARTLGISLSIGIGTRWPGGGEEIDTLLNRVDRVVREVKATDRGRWRVSRAE